MPLASSVIVSSMLLKKEVIPLLLSGQDLIWDDLNLLKTEQDLLLLLQENKSDPAKTFEIETLIARCQAASGRVTEGKNALDILEKRLPSLEPQRLLSIRFNLERARIYVLEKQPSRARKNLSEAWSASVEEKNDYCIIDVAQVMGALVAAKEQQTWLQKGIEVAEASSQKIAKRWLPHLYISLGWKWHELRQFELALAAFEKVAPLPNDTVSPRANFIAKWSIGRVLRSMNHAEKALDLQTKLLPKALEINFMKGRVWEEIAENLTILKRKEDAEEYFRLTYEFFADETNPPDELPLKTGRWKSLGKVKN